MSHHSSDDLRAADSSQDEDRNTSQSEPPRSIHQDTADRDIDAPINTEPKPPGPTLCNCDGHWHVSNLNDGSGFYSADVDDQVTALIDTAVVQELEFLKANGHGGGNWRRLLEDRIAALRLRVEGMRDA